MDTSSLASNTLKLMAIAGSWLTIVALMIRQSNRYADSLRALDTKLTGLTHGKADTPNTKPTGLTHGKADTPNTKPTGLTHGKADTPNTKPTGLTHGKADTPNTKPTGLTHGKADTPNTKLTGLTHGKADTPSRDVADVRERLGRIEGHLMVPEGFRPRRSRPPSGDDSPSDGPDLGHRQAG